MKLKTLLYSFILIGTLGMTSCNLKDTKYGEYTEKSGNYSYTTKVYVYTRGKTIEKVEFAKDSNHHTDPSIWGGASVWEEKEDEILKSFEGKSVKEIKKSSTNEVYDSVAGATLTSNRVYQAVKNALNS